MIERHDLQVDGDRARCDCGFSVRVAGASTAHVARLCHAHVASPSASPDAVRWFVGTQEVVDGGVVIW